MRIPLEKMPYLFGFGLPTEEYFFPSISNELVLIGKRSTENRMYFSPDELHSPQGENKKAALISPWRIRKLASTPLPSLSLTTGLKDLWGWRRRLFSLPLSWVFPYSNSPPVRKGMSSPWEEQDVCITPEKQRGETNSVFYRNMRETAKRNAWWFGNWYSI